MLVRSRRLLLLLMLLADAAGVDELHYLCSMNGLQQARGHRTLPSLVAAALITPVQVRHNLSPFSVSCSQGSRLSALDVSSDDIRTALESHGVFGRGEVTAVGGWLDVTHCCIFSFLHMVTVQLHMRVWRVCALPLLCVRLCRRSVSSENY